jgi:uncharacterized DUF497 family protein
VTVADEDEDEERYATPGMGALGRVLAMVYTMRGALIRIISAAEPVGARSRISHDD